MSDLYSFAIDINNGISQKQLNFLEYVGNNKNAVVTKSRNVGATRMLMSYALYQATQGMHVLYVTPAYSMVRYLKSMEKLFTYSGSGYDNICYSSISTFSNFVRGRNDISTVIFDEYRPDVKEYVEAKTSLSTWTHSFQTVTVASVENTFMQNFPSEFLFNR